MLAIVPNKRIAISTTLPLDQATQILASEVAPSDRRVRLYSTNVGRFEGTVSSNGFKIWRGIAYRNDFKPILYGKFCPSNEGTRIEVTFRLHSIVEVGILIWCLPFATLWIIYLLEGKDTLACLGLFFLLYLFVLSSFNVKLRNSVELLCRIYEEYTVKIGTASKSGRPTIEET